MALDSKKNTLTDQKLLQIHDLMVKARVTEERLIHIYKQGLGYFWIGGPGEEAFSVPLGLLIDKGQGKNKDWLYLHYRALPTLIAMGLDMESAFRTMFNKATDLSSGGRNFVNHYSIPKWNVAPITSVIEVQYSMAIGTAYVQKKEKGNKSLTVVTGGDAGSHESDFASCLIWSSRPKKELPILITVQNNQWGISTSYDEQHGSKSIAERAKAFQIESYVIDGNDPIKCYHTLKTAIKSIRKNRKPIFIEAKVSRLYGHSSASGANYVQEPCCIKNFEAFLIKKKLITKKQIKDIWERYKETAKKIQQKIMKEKDPQAESIWQHVYFKEDASDWRKF
ncbi:MAG: thiamine pyrophosphate-dependent dehydrogenase E1 component subunit alpha [Bdellovibrionales bacterium]|nr:thiamine pyrophosphate-dependent dehydrogenase E1 component subunit alpha [Bdellovibrionales bacterium]